MSDNLPDRMLTLAEVAKILGLGRTTLYDMAHEYERTNGRSASPSEGSAASFESRPRNSRRSLA